MSPEKKFFWLKFFPVHFVRNILSDLKSAKNSRFSFTHLDLLCDRSIRSHSRRDLCTFLHEYTTSAIQIKKIEKTYFIFCLIIQTSIHEQIEFWIKRPKSWLYIYSYQVTFVHILFRMIQEGLQRSQVQVSTCVQYTLWTKQQCAWR
jgi:hypothetical protein